MACLPGRRCLTARTLDLRLSTLDQQGLSAWPPRSRGKARSDRRPPSGAIVGLASLGMTPSDLDPGPSTLDSLMPSPFHFAFFVKDLASTRRFYGDVLGCSEGRSTETWVDFDFFGAQISAHTTGPVTTTTDAGVVDGVHVPMPHFGAVLGWEQFDAIAARLREAGVTFVIEPRLRFAGQPGEQKTMFLRDASGNALEFKAFR